MIGHRILYLLLALSLFVVSCSDDYSPFVYKVGDTTIEIARFAGGKVANVVLTFDDGTNEQYLHAVPALESRGLPATFFINGNMVRETVTTDFYGPSISALRDMVMRGFEVSNHTYNHVDLTKVSLDSARWEILSNDSLIEQWTGVRPLTFSFPHNARNKQLVSMAMEGRVGVRTFETGFGQTYRTTTYKDMVKWADEAVKKKEMVVAMYHGLESGYDSWKNPDELLRFFDYLVENEQTIWVSNFRDASKYMQERDYTALDFQEAETGILVTAHTHLDTSLFDFPLTLIVRSKSINRQIEITPGRSAFIAY